MTQSETKNFPCPYCGHDLLVQLYVDDGSHTADSAPLVDDEHGKHAICPECKKMVRMVGELGAWMPGDPHGR
jgi:predicted RNA-binding Zn-ribbon protein involved in translation (DUF1610 family)